MPILEPEISIKSPDKAGAEKLLLDELTKGLDALPAGRKVMFKLTLPEAPDFYMPLIKDKRVARVVALSGGYTRADACERLAADHGMIASFSRALAQDLRRSMTDAEFDEALAEPSTRSIGPRRSKSDPMAVDFYYASGSPYAWRVWLALEHKGAAYKRTTLSFDAGDLKTPKFQALNPRRKVPVLVDDDFVLYNPLRWSSISKTDGRRARRFSPGTSASARSSDAWCARSTIIWRRPASVSHRARPGRIRKTFEKSSPDGRAPRPATFHRGTLGGRSQRLSVHGALVADRRAKDGFRQVGFHRAAPCRLDRQNGGASDRSANLAAPLEMSRPGAPSQKSPLSFSSPPASAASALRSGD